MKGTRFIIKGFSEKILIWANGPSWAKKWSILTLDPPYFF